MHYSNSTTAREVGVSISTISSNHHINTAVNTAHVFKSVQQHHYIKKATLYHLLQSLLSSRSTAVAIATPTIRESDSESLRCVFPFDWNDQIVIQDVA